MVTEGQRLALHKTLDRMIDEGMAVGRVEDVNYSYESDVTEVTRIELRMHIETDMI